MQSQILQENKHTFSALVRSLSQYDVLCKAGNFVGIFLVLYGIFAGPVLSPLVAIAEVVTPAYGSSDSVNHFVNRFAAWWWLCLLTYWSIIVLGLACFITIKGPAPIRERKPDLV